MIIYFAYDGLNALSYQTDSGLEGEIRITSEFIIGFANLLLFLGSYYQEHYTISVRQLNIVSPYYFYPDRPWEVKIVEGDIDIFDEDSLWYGK